MYFAFSITEMHDCGIELSEKSIYDAVHEHMMKKNIGKCTIQHATYCGTHSAILVQFNKVYVLCYSYYTCINTSL